MVGTLCLSGVVLLKAGKAVSADIKTETNCVILINEAECYLNVAAKYNFIDNYASLNADVKLILEEATSNLAAIYAVNYDYTGYPSRVDAEDKINVLYQRANDCINLLQKMDRQDYLKGA